MKTYNALSKSFTDEVKTIMGGGKSIDDTFNEIKYLNKLTTGDGIEPGKDNKVYHYVDLGLSVKWATCNVGAKLASDEGLLFQFGRVDGYKYGDENHQFRTYEQNTQDTGNENIPKTASGKTYGIGETLQPADDAANVNMGGAWKMPTNGQLEELYNNTTYEVKTINSKPGMLFTSTKNGHQLFIPFAGCWLEDECGGFIVAGSGAIVWSSQVHPSDVDQHQKDVDYAYSLGCNSSGIAGIDGYPRSFAFSVRGVFQV